MIVHGAECDCVGTEGQEGFAIGGHCYTKADENDDYDGMWVCDGNLDNENLSIGNTYETREQAIAAAPDDLGLPKGEHFMSGRLSLSIEAPRYPYNGLRLLEDAMEIEYHEWNDDTREQWEARAAPFADELQRDLEDVWKRWIARHDLQQRLYRVEDTEHHEVGEDADDPK